MKKQLKAYATAAASGKLPDAQRCAKKLVSTVCNLADKELNGVDDDDDDGDEFPLSSEIPSELEKLMLREVEGARERKEAEWKRGCEHNMKKAVEKAKRQRV